MDHWVKHAFMEGEHDRMLQEASKSRLLRKLKDSPGNALASFRDERRSSIKGKLLYAAWIVVLIALWFVSIALSAPPKNYPERPQGFSTGP